jgi:hypothetical protein
MPNQQSVFSKYALPIGALVVIVLAIIAWYTYRSTEENSAAVVLSEQFDWSLTTGNGVSGPETTVVLRIAGSGVPIGVLPGTCREIEGGEYPLLPNELSGIICEREGAAGIEIGVFEEGQGLVLKQGTVNGGERSNFVPMTMPQEEAEPTS